MDENQILWDYDVICKVLETLFSDPLYIPRHEDFHDLNPQHDKIKVKILKIEASWQWRDLVYKSVSCDREETLNCATAGYLAQYHASMPYFCGRINQRINAGRIIPLNPTECHAFWLYYWHGAWNKQAGYAVKKVLRNFNRLRVVE
jgi:hypothetical protein